MVIYLDYTALLIFCTLQFTITVHVQVLITLPVLSEVRQAGGSEYVYTASQVASSS